MGSFITQQVAVTAPDRVEKLVLIGTARTVAIVRTGKSLRSLSPFSKRSSTKNTR